jgi:transcriptional regulator GlxA family with amidase domain
MRVAILVLDGVFDTGLAALCDTFEMANALAAPSRPPFTVTRIGLRRRVTSGQGLSVPVEAPPARAPDVVVAPALSTKTAESLGRALLRDDVRDATDLLTGWAVRRMIVAAACTGTFVLGAASLLDGRPATTTWWLASAFRAHFPRVKLDESRMLVEADNIVTAGAAVAHLDLALWIVRQASPSLAKRVGRFLTFDRRPTQSAYALPQRAAYVDELVERFETWARANLSRFSVEAAAHAVGASQRNLERRVRLALGKSPLAFIQELRVAEAVHHLETSDRSIDEIATIVGYESGVSLRSLLRKRTGLGVRALRARD